MQQEELQTQVSRVAESAGVPGVAVAIRHGEDQQFAYHGVTSIEDPLPVNERTLFQIGSTTKTFTATAIMRLFAQGRLDLDERVRAYVPELRLSDEKVADTVTVATLLNHTAGWDGGDEFPDTGDGDDALARYIDTLHTLPQRTLPGSAVSYNNAAVVLAGRVIEKVTGQTYERAMAELLLDPLGMEHSFLRPAQVMEHRFSAGHQREDGETRVVRPWASPRAVGAAGGISSTVADLLTWARFHLGDGGDLLPTELLHRMRQPSTDMELFPGVRVGLTWWLRDVDGTRIVEHPGDGAGQMSAFTMVPERDFAIAVLVNCVPNGQAAKVSLVRWALESYLGVVERDPEPLELAPEQLAAYVGTYVTDAVRMDTTVNGRRLDIVVEMEPGGGEPTSHTTYQVGIFDGDRFIVVDGPYQGLQGYFARDGEQVVALAHIGRLATKV